MRPRRLRSNKISVKAFVLMFIGEQNCLRHGIFPKSALMSSCRIDELDGFTRWMPQFGSISPAARAGFRLVSVLDLYFRMLKT